MNNITIFGHPLPDVQDCIATVNSATTFLKADVVNLYGYIPDEPADILKTAITMLFGTYEHVWMPFGLCHIAQTFQRFIDRLAPTSHSVSRV